MIWLLGIAGNVAFAWACVPTAFKTWRAGRSVGTPVTLAWNILTACLLFYAYVLARFGFDLLIFTCGSIEITAYAVVIWFHYNPRRMRNV